MSILVLLSFEWLVDWLLFIIIFIFFTVFGCLLVLLSFECINWQQMDCRRRQPPLASNCLPWICFSTLDSFISHLLLYRGFKLLFCIYNWTVWYTFNLQPSHVYRRKPFIKVKVDILVPLTIIAIFVEMTLKSDQNSDPDQSFGRLPQFMPFSRGHSDISNRGDNCSYHQPTITSDFRKRLNFCIL